MEEHIQNEEFQEPEHEDVEEEEEEIGEIKGLDLDRGGRGVTLPMLVADKILEPGKGIMTIDYLGQKFTGDLLENGTICSRETQQIFSTPSAWALHCKRIINPEKKSGCGWSSVRYKGKRLDFYKALWIRRKRDSMSAVENGIQPNVAVEKKRSTSGCGGTQEVALYENIAANWNNISQTTLVKAVTLSDIERLQPFLVVTSAELLATVQFHCSISSQQVVGYVGGKWDNNTQTLSLVRAYPCLVSNSSVEEARAEEYRIKQQMQNDSLQLAAWYHSHPLSKAQPSIRDTLKQLSYELIMRGNTDSSYRPCVGLIFAPNDISVSSSQLLCYWVAPPPESRPSDLPRPLSLQYVVAKAETDLLPLVQTLVNCLEFYLKFGSVDAEGRALLKHRIQTFVDVLFDGRSNEFQRLFQRM
ncbi:MPN domain-containing protein-like [Artemia franciscana]|uniref:MPN domain-containing protein n=1 Tax=Artemia franciscana TaxID=6661 RepID=A0AA88L8K1_ARTSF|nr:hypothetical protein QYM36_002872 [Artemia franciscana]